MAERHRGIKRFRNMKYPSSRACYLCLYSFCLLLLDFAEYKLVMELDMKLDNSKLIKHKRIKIIPIARTIEYVLVAQVSGNAEYHAKNSIRIFCYCKGEA